MARRIEYCKDHKDMDKFVPPTGREVSDRLHRFYDAVVRSLNLSELNVLLVQEKLLTAQEAHHIVTSPGQLIQKVEEFGLSGYEKLYSCISKERKHLGHLYVQALLENKNHTFASEEECATIKDKVIANLHTLASCDLRTLLTHMYSKELLTPQEWKNLETQMNDTNALLVSILVLLDTKGPLAYPIFAHCLQNIDSAMYAHVFESVDPEKSLQSKRRRSSELAMLQAPHIKKALPKLKLHGCLRGSRYNLIMTVFQGCHHNGKWAELEEEASKLSTPDTPKELRIVALLERAVSWVFRKQEVTVLGLVTEAKRLCTEVNGDNATFLEGRCEYILSRLYRYLKQYDRAEEHIRKATYLLYMAEPGEDSAFVHYCDACIQVEKLSENPTEKKLQHAGWSFQYAIDHARTHDSGLDLVASHSFMRLAQMYLGSSHYSAGSQRDDETIAKASSCLKAVDQSSLAQRSKCHYLLIQSDLQRCQQKTECARSTARNALEIAQTHNFTLEITSAGKRLDTL
jgi:hypothetical protein